MIVYITIGGAIGALAYYQYNYTTAISVCLGGMFILGCGLIHLASYPKRIRLPKQFTNQINVELNQLRKENRKTRDELQEFKENIVEQNRVREEKIVDELKDLAQAIALFAAKKRKEAYSNKEAPANNIDTDMQMLSDDEELADNVSRLAPANRNHPANLNQRQIRHARSMLQTVQDAIDASRVEIHLQPIVSLPQRRVTFYECFTRLRDESGQLIMPGEFLKVAESSGLAAEIDNMLLLKCVQLARLTIRRDRRIALFCNISASSLGDESFFAQFVDFLKQNRDLVGSLIFEMSHAAFEHLSLASERNMGRLYDLGYRFSLDRCDTLDLDLRRLEKMGVRYVKIGGDRLVDDLLYGDVQPLTGLARDFEPHDIAALFARYGIDIIADRIEDERTIIEILELDIGFAQGNLFGSPRPLGEVMEPDAEAGISHRRFG